MARLNFIAHDRADLQYAVKEASRHMSKPTNRDWRKIVRTTRYLKKKPRVQSEFNYTKNEGKLE